MVFDCTIRDLTEFGARLKLETTMDVPDEFLLYLVHLRQRVKVEVRWRTASSLGVEFMGEPETGFQPYASLNLLMFSALFLIRKPNSSD